MDPPIDIDQALAEAARMLEQPLALERSLQDVAEAAQRSVPGFEHASVTQMHPDARFEARAFTSLLASRLDEAQYDLAEGPCLDTVLHSGGMVSVPRLRSERRWPSYVPRAVAQGVQSHLSVKLRLDGESTSGGLNLYSTTTEHVSREAEAMAELFGVYAVTGGREPSTLVESSPAVESLEVVGQALDLVMNRFRLTSNRAFDRLDESASRSGLHLADYAQRLVDEGRIP